MAEEICFEGWNPHRIEDRKHEYWFMSIDDAIKSVLLQNPEGLTSWDICKKLAANGLVIPQIISGVNRCLADRNYRSSLSDWFSRKIGDKWFVRILSDEQSA
jgi:hypothetical protein